MIDKLLEEFIDKQKQFYVQFNGQSTKLDCIVMKSCKEVSLTIL